MEGQRLAVRISSDFKDKLEDKLRERKSNKRDLIINLLEEWVAKKDDDKKGYNIKKDIYFDVHIPKELNVAVKQKAHESNLKVTDVVRDLLEDWLDNQN